MAVERALGAPRLPQLRWAILVPLVLLADVVVASLAWWMVGLILK
jgi:hypothetical protein